MNARIQLIRLATRLESLAIEMRRDDAAATAGYRTEISAALAEISRVLEELGK